MAAIAIFAGQGWMVIRPHIFISNFVLLDAARRIMMVVRVGCDRRRHMRQVMRRPRGCRACKEQGG
jgi:hypothetical protein